LESTGLEADLESTGLEAASFKGILITTDPFSSGLISTGGDIPSDSLLDL